VRTQVPGMGREIIGRGLGVGGIMWLLFEWHCGFADSISECLTEELALRNSRSQILAM
jgi:hypothetical protein